MSPRAVSWGVAPLWSQPQHFHEGVPFAFGGESPRGALSPRMLSPKHALQRIPPYRVLLMLVVGGIIGLFLLTVLATAGINKYRTGSPVDASWGLGVAPPVVPAADATQATSEMPEQPQKTRLRITNGCEDEVLWVGHVESHRSSSPRSAEPLAGEQNHRLAPLESWDVEIPREGLRSTRFWSKWRCVLHGDACGVGDSGGGDQLCDDAAGCAPAIDSKIEATFGVEGEACRAKAADPEFSGCDFVDVGVQDGFTVPFQFNIKGDCKGQFAHDVNRIHKVVNCKDLTMDLCPNSEDLGLGAHDVSLEVINPTWGSIAGCHSPCSKLSFRDWNASSILKTRMHHQEQNHQRAAPYCCPNKAACEKVVPETLYAKALREMCPGVNAYPYDQTGTAIGTCPSGTKYEMTFYCPTRKPSEVVLNTPTREHKDEAREILTEVQAEKAAEEEFVEDVGEEDPTEVEATKMSHVVMDEAPIGWPSDEVEATKTIDVVMDEDPAEDEATTTSHVDMDSAPAEGTATKKPPAVDPAKVAAKIEATMAAVEAILKTEADEREARDAAAATARRKAAIEEATLHAPAAEDAAAETTTTKGSPRPALVLAAPSRPAEPSSGRDVSTDAATSTSTAALRSSRKTTSTSAPTTTPTSTPTSTSTTTLPATTTTAAATTASTATAATTLHATAIISALQTRGRAPVRLRITNGCKKETLWIAGKGQDSQDLGVFRLVPQSSRSIDVLDGLSSRYWPKLGCNDQGKECAIGDSWSRDGKCENSKGCAPSIDTRFEGTFGLLEKPCNLAEGRTDGCDFIDLSLANGFTLPFKMTVHGDCKSERAADTDKVYRTIDCSDLSVEQCPCDEQLGSTGSSVNLRVGANRSLPTACYSPCSKLTDSRWNNELASASDDSAKRDVSQFCCPTPPETPQSCRAGPASKSKYVEAVHRMCPGVSGYAYDEQNGLLHCPAGTRYEMTFYCPTEAAASDSCKP